jgi:hypothetical protein
MNEVINFGNACKLWGVRQGMVAVLSTDKGRIFWKEND